MVKKRKYEKHLVKNLDIRALIAGNGITYKEIAEHIHVSQSTLSQWFFFDLKDWQKKEILGAIVVIVKERGDELKTIQGI